MAKLTIEMENYSISDITNKLSLDMLNVINATGKLQISGRENNSLIVDSANKLYVSIDTIKTNTDFVSNIETEWNT